MSWGDMGVGGRCPWVNIRSTTYLLCDSGQDPYLSFLIQKVGELPLCKIVGRMKEINRKIIRNIWCIPPNISSLSCFFFTYRLVARALLRNRTDRMYLYREMYEGNRLPWLRRLASLTSAGQATGCRARGELLLLQPWVWRQLQAEFSLPPGMSLGLFS